MAEYSSGETSIGELVRRLESNYVYGTTTISKYVSKSMYDDLQKIDAYLNSKHTSGETDSLGREKPFFNIVTAAVNIWYRATDLDRKDIKIKPTEVKNTFSAFLATIHLQDWMRRAKFGYFLNDWGRALARYGSVPVKFVEKDGELEVLVVPWNRMICDVVDFDANPKIEVIELTEAQLYERGYDKEQVEALCEARTARRLLTKQTQDKNNDYIRLYEVNGKLPLSYLTENPDDAHTFVQQMITLSYVATKKKGEFQDFVLYKGQAEYDPYMITHLIKEDGQTLSIGAVQHLFETQWMVNHTAKAIKDQLDLASKLIFQTSDGSFVGTNAINAIENGDILIHKVNEPLTQVANTSHDVTSLMNFSQMWKSLGNEINGISESMMGKTATSGTPWRQVDALLQESHSLFELMTENKGLHVEDMLRERIIPFIRKKYLNHSKEIAADLEGYNLSKIDQIFVKNTAIKKANAVIVNKILNGENPSPKDQAGFISQYMGETQNDLASQGNTRFFVPSEEPDTTWKVLFKDLPWDVEIDITGENAPDKDDLATLNTVLQTIANNPRVLMDPNAKLIFNKILNIAGGVSPLELTDAQPYIPLPSRRFTETLDYVDAPDDIKRQMEEQAGFQPSQMGNSAPAAPAGAPAPSPMAPRPAAPTPTGP